MIPCVVWSNSPKYPHAPEGHWLWRDLNGDGQAYTYFIVRQDGKFMIRQRAGAGTKDVMAWTDNAAVVKADAAGKATNKLEILVAVAGDRLLYSMGAGAKERLAAMASGRPGAAPSARRSSRR